MVKHTLKQSRIIIPFEDLDKHFTAPKIISPFFNCKRVPRKFKKKYSNILQGYRFSYLTLNQKLWYILGLTNPNYRDFLIKQVIIREYEREKYN